MSNIEPPRAYKVARLIVIMGPVGRGKSTVGKALAAALSFS